MSIAKKISMKHAILQVIEETDDMYVRFLPTLLKWGKQSYMRIVGDACAIEAVSHLTVVGDRAALPLSAVYITIAFMGNIDILPGQWGTDQLAEIGELNINGEQQLFIYTGDSKFALSGIPWKVQDNYIVFDRNIDGQEITLIINVIESDPEGIPLIEENFVEAIAKFIEFKIAEKENSMKFRRSELRQPDLIYVKNLKRDYHNLVAKARIPATASQHHQIALMFNYPWTGSSII